jgi:hypothetical protein
MKKIVLCTFIIFFLFSGINAFAYSFEDIVVGEFDLSNNFSLTVTEVDGTDNDPAKIAFTFTNTGTEDYSIAGIYWAGKGLLSNTFFSSDVSSPGVDFKITETPKDKDTPLDDENFSTAFYAQIANSGQHAGIDRDESATFLFDVVPGQDFGKVLDALKSDGELKIAIDVSVGGKKKPSDTYLASVTPVPEPATMLLLGAGLIGIAGLGRKKLFKKK